VITGVLVLALFVGEVRALEGVRGLLEDIAGEEGSGGDCCCDEGGRMCCRVEGRPGVDEGVCGLDCTGCGAARPLFTGDVGSIAEEGKGGGGIDVSRGVG
jgi:hypothetical protein